VVLPSLPSGQQLLIIVPPCQLRLIVVFLSFVSLCEYQFSIFLWLTFSLAWLTYARFIVVFLPLAQLFALVVASCTWTLPFQFHLNILRFFVDFSATRAALHVLLFFLPCCTGWFDAFAFFLLLVQWHKFCFSFWCAVQADWCFCFSPSRWWLINCFSISCFPSHLLQGKLLSWLFCWLVSCKLLSWLFCWLVPWHANCTDAIQIYCCFSAGSLPCSNGCKYYFFNAGCMGWLLLLFLSPFVVWFSPCWCYDQKVCSIQCMCHHIVLNATDLHSSFFIQLLHFPFPVARRKGMPDVP